MLLFIGTGIPAFAQLGATLPAIIKSVPRSTFYMGLANGKVDVFDSTELSLYRNQNVATLLAQLSTSFIRNYGTNGLSTLSLRGASAAQTAVVWNGIPIQNGATGIIDLSLIPVAMVDNMYLEYGGSAASVGSGAVGGVLRLYSGPNIGFKKANVLDASIAAGSFGLLEGNIRSIVSSKKWFASLNVAGQASNNDFRYEDELGMMQRLSNSRLHAFNIQGLLSHQFPKDNQLTLDIWGSKYYRQIPPALFEPYSVKEQRDASIRTSLIWGHSVKRIRHGIQASFISDWFRYQDSVAVIHSAYQTTQLYSSLWLRGYLSRHRYYELTIPVQYNAIVGLPSNSILRSAIVGHFRKLFYGNGRFSDSSENRKTVQSTASISSTGRVELISGKVYGFGEILLAYRLTKYLSVHATLANTYRTPTLNELYYTPGGNPDLKPERGWSTEIGYILESNQTDRTITFTHSGTAFYRDIHDWILWFGGAIWTPHNIAEVASMGLETENKLVYKRPHIIYQLSANATLISSKTVQSSLPGDGSIGHQIPYAPRIIAQGNAGFNAAQFRFNYNQTFTGDRYYNSDETGLLPAYATGNIQAGWLYKRNKWSLDLSIMIQNIWEQRYAEVSGRPAPGINYIAGMTLSHR